MFVEGLQTCVTRTVVPCSFFASEKVRTRFPFEEMTGPAQGDFKKAGARSNPGCDEVRAFMFSSIKKGAWGWYVARRAEFADQNLDPYRQKEPRDEWDENLRFEF